eukprot:g18482.t1
MGFASLEHCYRPETEMLAREQGGKGAMGLWGGVGNEGRVDQGFLEGTVPAEGRQGTAGEYVSGDGTSLEVVEMAADDLLDVDAGGMVG